MNSTHFDIRIIVHSYSMGEKRGVLKVPVEARCPWMEVCYVTFMSLIVSKHLAFTSERLLRALSEEG